MDPSQGALLGNHKLMLHTPVECNCNMAAQVTGLASTSDWCCCPFRPHRPSPALPGGRTHAVGPGQAVMLGKFVLWTWERRIISWMRSLLFGWDVPPFCYCRETHPGTRTGWLRLHQIGPHQSPRSSLETIVKPFNSK